MLRVLWNITPGVLMKWNWTSKKESLEKTERSEPVKLHQGPHENQDLNHLLRWSYLNIEMILWNVKIAPIPRQNFSLTGVIRLKTVKINCWTPPGMCTENVIFFLLHQH